MSKPKTIKSKNKAKKVLFYTKGTVNGLRYDGMELQISISPATSYSQLRGEVKCIALYEKGKETESSGVRFCDDKKAFGVDPKVPAEWLLQQKKNGSEIKFVFANETIVGIEL